MTIQDGRGMTALELLQENYRYGQNAKIVLLKLAANYNHVPKLPSEDVTVELKTILPQRLSLSTQVTQKTQYTSYVPFYGAAPWKQQHLQPIALLPMLPYCLNTPQYMPPTKL
jgi:hypothetical protein